MNDRNKKSKPKGKEKRQKRVSDKLGVLYGIVLLAFVGLSIRVISIVVNNNNEYQRKILSQQAYDSKTLKAKRGEIVDANGTILATSKEKYNVILDVALLLEADKDTPNMCVDATVSALTNVFGVDSNAIRAYIRDVPDSRYYIVKRGVEYDEMNRFQSFTNKPEAGKESESLYNKDVKGVWFEKYYVRDYPQKQLACDVIGFSLSDGMASYGLEEYYNDCLCGTDGRQFGYLNDDTTLEYTTIAAVDGNTLVTTLDANVQMMVEKYIKKFALEYKDNYRDGLGARNIGCIFMEANTGNVLAMASYPNYDLNNPYDLSSLYSEEEMKQLDEEGGMKDACDALWRNFCITDTYEPGSVMKPFTVAAGLETGTLRGDETYYCGGYLTVAGQDIYCHNRSGDGMLDVRGAVAQSCNVALMTMVESIGKDNFLDYQKTFNFGLRTNIDLSGETRTDTLVFNERTMGESELATSSFGQGFNVTMIQMAAGYAALVNGGYYYEPHMVSKILSPGGAVIKNIEPRVIKQVISNQTSDTIRSYCNSVVTDGTGWRARPAGYRVGGKTGTAETVPRGQGDYVISFMCHIPADNPQYICYVVIDRPNVASQDDAKYSSIVSKEIMNAVLPYLNVPMTEEISDAEMEELKSQDISVFTNRLWQEKADENTDENPDGGDGNSDGTGESGDNEGTESEKAGDDANADNTDSEQ